MNESSPPMAGRLVGCGHCRRRYRLPRMAPGPSPRFATLCPYCRATNELPVRLPPGGVPVGLVTQVGDPERVPAKVGFMGILGAAAAGIILGPLGVALMRWLEQEQTE